MFPSIYYLNHATFNGTKSYPVNFWILMAASDSMSKSQLSLWDSGHLNFVNHQRLCWTSPRYKEAFTECVGMRLRDGANKPWSICKGRCPRRGRPNRIKPCFAERETQAQPTWYWSSSSSQPGPGETVSPLAMAIVYDEGGSLLSRWHGT